MPLATLRRTADEIGIDPWDICRDTAHAYMALEHAPESRFRLGSPCRWVKAIDAAVHVYLPAMLEERWPLAADALRRTSPRWGRAWRHWPTPVGHQTSIGV